MMLFKILWILSFQREVQPHPRIKRQTELDRDEDTMKQAADKGGMTIVEMLFASMILAIVMASVFPLVDNLLGRIHMSRDHYVATTICQARIERSKAIPYPDLPLMDESDTLVDDFGNLAVPDGRFRRTTTVTPNVPSQGMTQMVVSTDICICSRWGWRRYLHPVQPGKHLCRFTEEHEEMTYLFTEYKNR